LHFGHESDVDGNESDACGFRTPRNPAKLINEGLFGTSDAGLSGPKLFNPGEFG